MKKTIAIILLCAAILQLFCITALAEETLPPSEDENAENIIEGTLGDSFTWSFHEDGTLTVNGSGAMPDLVSYEDQPWRYLAADIKKVKISYGITAIGANSFGMCAKLSTVSLPNTLKAIGNYAFEKCYAIKFIDLPSSVTKIENGAFYDCWQLAEVDIGRFASYLEYIGDDAFAGCTNLKKINLPARLTHIGEGAFLSCYSLNGITLPDKLSYLGRFAFQDCASLTSVNIPWQITVLPDYVFLGCTSLERVTFGRYFESVGRDAFLWCASLKEIHFPQSVTGISDYSVGYYYFGREYVKYDGVTVIAGSSAGIDYAVKNGFRLIVDDASHVCSGICGYCGGCTVECEYYQCYDKCLGHTFPITGSVDEGITWSLSEDYVLSIDGVGAMPDYVFNNVPWSAYKSSIQKVVIGEGITYIGNYTFDSHSALTEVTIPEGVTALGRKAFGLCSALSGVTLPESVAVIGELAFHGCTSLEYVFFGEAMESIGDYAFYGCVRLLEAELSEGVISISEGAFECCPMLESFYVPESVVVIGEYALGYSYSGNRQYYKNDNFTIRAPLFSVGCEYAEENGFTYERTDTHVCESLCEVCGRCLDVQCAYPECPKKCDGLCTAEWDWQFTDVREGDWYADSVRYVYLKGLFTGMTEDTFVPSGGVTRAQLAVVLWRLAGSPIADSDAGFEDLSAAWYRDAVNWAYEAGVVTGKSETEFDPMGAITREQMVTMLMRFCKNVAGYDVTSRGDVDSFGDIEEVSQYALEAVSWAMAEGLITGKEQDGVICLAPLMGATRAECATIFSRLLKKM